MLTKEEIRLACLSEAVYQKARQLCYSGGVTSFYLEEYEDGILELSADVRGCFATPCSSPETGTRQRRPCRPLGASA